MLLILIAAGTRTKVRVVFSRTGTYSQRWVAIRLVHTRSGGWQLGNTTAAAVRVASKICRNHEGLDFEKKAPRENYESSRSQELRQAIHTRGHRMHSIHEAGVLRVSESTPGAGAAQDTSPAIRVACGIQVYQRKPSLERKQLRGLLTFT